VEGPAVYSLLATDFLADLTLHFVIPGDDQLIPPATNAGCPIQALFLGLSGIHSIRRAVFVTRSSRPASRQVEKEITLQKSRRMRGPEGRQAKLQPSPEGLGIDREDALSAVGAALNLVIPLVVRLRLR
jgi:hypothetical protein